MTVTRVLLVDDETLVRFGFRTILGSSPGIEVVGEAADGKEAIDMVRTLHPDVVCMDVQMPVLDGLSATREITAATSAAVLVLTTFNSDAVLFEALDAGASGFLLKTSQPEQLIAAVHALARGDALLAPSVTRRVIERYSTSEPRERSRAGLTDLHGLTEREREVLGHLARGFSNADIADRLVVGEATVKTHVSNVLRKLAIRDRLHAVIWAYEHGIVKPGETETSS